VNASNTTALGRSNDPADPSQTGWNAKILAKARLLHQELLKLHGKIDTTFLEVGVRLKEIRDHGLYQPLKHPSFNAYVQSLEFSRSRAYALIGVVEDFYLSSRLDRSQMVAIGWEKLVLLRVVKDAVSFTKWALRAQEVGKRQLRQALVESGFIAPARNLNSEQESDMTEAPATELQIEPNAEPNAERSSESSHTPPQVHYLAIKKMTAVRWIPQDELEAAKKSGNYPLIVGVVGAAHSLNGAAQGLPRLALAGSLPTLEREETTL